MCFNCLVKQNYFKASTINFKIFESELNKQIINTLAKQLLHKKRPIRQITNDSIYLLCMLN